MGKYEDAAAALGRLLDEKNEAYGNAFAEAHSILEVLYPNGVPIEQYTRMLVFARVLDKMFRMAKGDPNYKGECPAKDAAGYFVLLWILEEEAQAKPESPAKKIMAILDGNPDVEEPEVFTEYELPCNAKIMVVELDDDNLTEDPAGFAKYMSACKMAYISNHNDEKAAEEDGIRNGKWFVTPNGSMFYRYNDGTCLEFER